MPQPSSESNKPLPQPPESPLSTTGRGVPTSENPQTVSFPEAETGNPAANLHLEEAAAVFSHLEHSKEAQIYISPGPPKTLTKLTATTDNVIKSVTDAQSSELASNVEAACKSDDLRNIRESVNMFVDSLPAFLGFLEEIAGVHPFIKVAVSAFRVVVELHMRRHDNDKQINVLFVQMRDTMETLRLLKDIKDGEPIGPSGRTIKALLEGLVQKTADDIKNCANTCDAYVKKGTFARTLRSSSWEKELKGWVECFAQRQKDFTLALSAHASVSMVGVDQKLAGIEIKVDIVLKWFSELVSPEQQALTELVKTPQFGGAEKVIADPNKLRDLLKRYRPATSTATRAADGSQRNANGTTTKGGKYLDEDEFARVKRELSDSPEQAIQRNVDQFDRKYQKLEWDFILKVEQIVHQEGNRVIEVFAESGAHNKIEDPDICEIWREMQWPGHVKARHFVLALRDYYCQVLDRKPNTTLEDEGATSSRVASDDKWALGWINVNRLQAITEAFDDDASGFITIAEVNNFTASRPKNWSLLHWLAYWAIGWQMTATEYRDEITIICARMFAIRPYLHPSNRGAVTAYLRALWGTLSLLTSSLSGTYQSDFLGERFRSYVEAEEQRLREGLETFKYVIDGLDTLSLITGQGRIEKYLFPLLLLLLRRDLEIIRLCRDQVIHLNELPTSILNIRCVFAAVGRRHGDLQALFQQQKLDSTQQFRVFASELLGHWNNPNAFLSLENLLTVSFLEVEDDEIEGSDSDQAINTTRSKLLLYPSAADALYTPALVEDATTAPDRPAINAAVHLILGRWSGFQHHSASKDQYTYPMRVFDLHASQDGTTAEASGVGSSGGVFTVSVKHTTRVSDGIIEYTFTYSQVLRLTNFSDSIWVCYMTGTLDEDRTRLSGRWGYSEDEQVHPFTLWRAVPPMPVTIIDRPHPEEFEKNKPGTLWKYALTVARNEARRKLFSWSYIKKRRDARREFLELRQKDEDDMSPKDWSRLGEIYRMSTADDVRWFHLFYERQNSILEHDDRSCDACGVYPIRGTRVVCLQCGIDDAFDFCDTPVCLGCIVKTPRLLRSSHLPTHDLVKIRTVIVDGYEIGNIIRKAMAGLDNATILLDNAGNGGSGQERVQRETEGSGQEWEGPKQDRAQLIIKGEEGENGFKPEVEDTEKEPNEQGHNSEGQAKHEDMRLACLRCDALVSRPCLYCIDCNPWVSDRRFICWDCDEKEAGFNDGKHHKATHNLVRCMPRTFESTEDTSLTVDRRLEYLEAKVEGLTGQMGEIKELLLALVQGRTTEP